MLYLGDQWRADSHLQLVPSYSVELNIVDESDAIDVAGEEHNGGTGVVLRFERVGSNNF